MVVSKLIFQRLYDLLPLKTTHIWPKWIFLKKDTTPVSATKHGGQKIEGGKVLFYFLNVALGSPLDYFPPNIGRK